MNQSTQTKQTISTTHIDDHKKMLLASGQLSDFQLKNLKTWPYLVFDRDKLSSVKIYYDFQNPQLNKDENLEDQGVAELYAGQITYDFHFDGGSRINPKQKTVALEKLLLWTRFLFWKETKVIFKRDGKKWN